MSKPLQAYRVRDITREQISRNEHRIEALIVWQWEGRE